MRQLTIGIDLGGTNIKGGVCDAGGGVLAAHSIDTEADGGLEHVLARMAGLAAELPQRAGVAREDIAAIGIGAPGPM